MTLVAALGLGTGAAVAGQAQGQGQAQAEPCAVGRLSFPGGSFPSGVRMRNIPNEPSIELPFRRLGVLVNRGDEPFYLVAEVGSPAGEDRLNSDIPAQYYPFFKLQDGQVFEWRLPSVDDLPSMPNQGAAPGGYSWHPLTEKHFSYREVSGDAGVILVPDAFAYLTLSGKPLSISDCDDFDRPVSRSVSLNGFWRGEPVMIEGTIRYEPYR